MRTSVVYALILVVCMILTMSVSVIAADAQLKIMPLGDSITHGGFNGDASYRVALYRDLTNAGINFTYVGSMATVFNESSSNPNPAIYPEYFAAGFPKKHEGHAGWTTAQVATGSGVASSISTYKPDVVTIHLGTNDLGQQLISASNNFAPAITNLTTIVNKLRAANPNVKIALAQVIPYKPTAYNNTSYTQIAGYNTRLAEFAAGKTTQASPIVVVDQYTGFDILADHTSDGLHPNQYGEQKMADRFYMAVQQMTHPETRVLCPLNINNSSFEDGTPATDTTINSSLGAKGWVINRVSDGSTGSDFYFQNPGSNLYIGAAGNGTPQGAQGKGIAFFFNRPGTTLDSMSWISQTIGGYLQDDVIYTLSVAVGKRIDRTFAGGRIELLAGDTIIGSQIVNADSSIPVGQFIDITFSVNSNTLDQALMGKFLTIKFSPLTDVEWGMVDFDNIRLTSMEIPEPATAIFMIASLAYFAAKRRQK